MYFLVKAPWLPFVLRRRSRSTICSLPSRVDPMVLIGPERRYECDNRKGQQRDLDRQHPR
jgi:hypothetical protein